MNHNTNCIPRRIFVVIIKGLQRLQYHSSPSAIARSATMATKPSAVPTWVAQLRSPPPPKSRVPGVPDPIGFSAPSGSKVSTAPNRLCAPGG